MNNTSPYIVAIEIGSSKIKGAVGQIDSSGVLTVKGIEEEKQHPNFVRYGCVQNVMEVANELNRVMTKLNNRISPEKISAVYLGVGGRSLKTTPATLGMSLANDTEVTHEIVSNLLDRARPASSEVELLAVEPEDFLVDGKSQGVDPVGVLGREISAKVKIVSCRSQLMRNLKLAVNEKLNIDINGYVVRPMAMADLVLTVDEKRLGVMMVDCGAETTTVAIYKKGVLAYLATIPLGSRHITRDLTALLPYTDERAEELKRVVGTANAMEAHRATMDEVDTTQINNIVSARSAEIITNINAQLEYAGVAASDLPAGIVVVGGGSMLRGFAEELSKITTLGVRRGALPAIVRMSGAKISTGEDLDVISLLYELSLQESVKPCTTAPMKTPEPEEPADEEDFADEEDEDDDFLDEEPKSKSGSLLGGLWKKIKGQVTDTPDDLGDYDE